MKLEIADCLYISNAAGHKGRGVFTSEDLPANAVVEVSPVLVMSAAERTLLDKTALYNYIFEWNPRENQCCAAWGYISMYNHSYASNCEYFMDYEKHWISIKTVCPVAAGSELTINYNGDWNDEAAVWFDAEG